MPPEERDLALIYDMLDAARQWATDRGFNIIGEAARRVSDVTKATHSGVAWRRIVGLRNVIVHDYDEVDYVRHWRVIQEDLPQLIVELEKINP
jgi:uncharacterized protein with HEPN domain